MADTVHDPLFDEVSEGRQPSGGEGGSMSGLTAADLPAQTTLEGGDSTDGGRTPKLEFFDEQDEKEKASPGHREGTGEVDRGSEGTSDEFETLSPPHVDELPVQDISGGMTQLKLHPSQYCAKGLL